MNRHILYGSVDNRTVVCTCRSHRTAVGDKTPFSIGLMEAWSDIFDIWINSCNPQIVREETRCHHMGYSFQLAVRVLLYASSHTQDNTYHSLCYTSRGALAETRNSSVCSREVISYREVEHHVVSHYWKCIRTSLNTKIPYICSIDVSMKEHVLCY